MKYMLGKNKGQKGITLIALIITIIVLLILSLVTINSIFGGDSAMDKARQAKEANEKGEISDMLALAISNIKLKQAQDKYKYDKGYYYETQDRFIESGGNVLSTNAYVIKDYNPETEKVTFSIKKKGGTGIEFEYEIDIKSGKITNTNQIPTGDNGGSSSGNNSGNNGNNGNNNDNVANVTPTVYTDPEFYVCDEGGNRLENQNDFSAYFDKNLETYVSRDTAPTLQVRWTGNLTGKLLYVNCTTRASNYCRLEYKDSIGNTLEAYNLDGIPISQILNYTSDESVTYIPENASYIEIYDYDTPGDIHAIQLFEAGYYTNNYITNIKTVGNTANKIGLEWTQDAGVQEVKVYNDGTYLGTSSNGKYTIDSGLMNNTTYNIFLEPVTSDVTNNLKNQKTKVDITTLSDTSGFYIDGISDIAKKHYTAWFDKNLDTCVNQYSDQVFQIKWTGNIAGKLLYLKTTGTYRGDYYLVFKDETGNTINTYKPDGTLALEGYVLNYQEGESVTVVPQNASYIEFEDWENGDIYEIQVFEEGKFIQDYITNVNSSNVGANSLSLSWNKTADVVKTKVYQDGTLLGETEGTTYTVASGLLSNTEYEYYLEPITSSTTTGVKCKKAVKKVTTASDGYDLHIDGTNNLTKKAYTSWFDKNLDTCVNQYSNQVFQIKWTGNIAGKKVYIKSSGSSRSYYYIVYKDSVGNILDAYKVDGTQAANNYLNYQEGEAVTVVPENASYIEFEDWENGDIYEIQIQD